MSVTVQATESGKLASPVPDAGDDMHDSPAELAAAAARAPKLALALQEFQRALVPRFHEADRSALDNQRRVRRIIYFTAAAGTTAVLLASVQLALKLLALEAAAQAMAILQLVVILASTAAVAVGKRTGRKDGWLLERHKAERLRLLKYGYLVDLEWWCGGAADAADWRARLDHDIARIAALAKVDLPRLAVEESLLDPPRRDACHRVSPPELQALVDYYEAKRLGAQRRYFAKRASEGPPSWYDNPRLLGVVFFGSVGLVVLNFVFEMLWQQRQTFVLQLLSTVCAILASVLPAVWAGLRFSRSASELPRNVSRSRARLAVLDELSARLRAQRDDAEGVFWMLRQAEYTLAADQREWLRVMREAKWHK
ncbi:MAG TPA: hypothetical protein VJ596_09645 [Gemmatimonadaceae bacterium]|nr:hypothetical protein [Gemmatimonadaceae bacterium]